MPHKSNIADQQAEMHSLIPGMLILLVEKMSWKLDEYVIYKEL
jgi:hypothetical protein